MQNYKDKLTRPLILIIVVLGLITALSQGAKTFTPKTMADVNLTLKDEGTDGINPNDTLIADETWKCGEDGRNIIFTYNDISREQLAKVGEVKDDFWDADSAGHCTWFLLPNNIDAKTLLNTHSKNCVCGYCTEGDFQILNQ